MSALMYRGKLICVLRAIVVKKRFEISNGLSGMQRNIIIRICNLTWNKTNEIRAIFGLCAEYYEWKKSRFFLTGRPLKITVSFLSNKQNMHYVKDTPTGMQCLFRSNNVQTLFLSKMISEGVYRWTVRINYASKDCSEFQIGVAPVALATRCVDKLLGWFEGTSAVGFYRDDLERENKFYLLPGGFVIQNSYLCGVEKCPHSFYFPEVTDDSLVTIEVDCAARAVCFFFNGEKIPPVICGVRLPLLIGISVRGGASFVSTSFLRVHSTLRSTVVCRFFQAIQGESDSEGEDRKSVV